jgi:hypothetical protein
MIDVGSRVQLNMPGVDDHAEGTVLLVHDLTSTAVVDFDNPNAPGVIPLRHLKIVEPAADSGEEA